MNIKKKIAVTASLLAMGLSAHAAQERIIVTFADGKGPSVKAIAAKSGGEIKVELERQNAFAVEMPAAAINGLKNNPNVLSVEVDAKRFPLAVYNDTLGDPNTTQVTPYNYFQIEADQLSYQGGQKVCVIDSGIARENGETGGRNNDFNWSNITGDNDSGTGDWFRDGGAHGTHVAGTVGAADNGTGVIGMAPGVAMHIIKVFNAAGWGYSSNLAQAANLCADAGANIINMSLGGGGASSVEENAFNNFRDNGGLVLAAAGNDGNSVRSYPAGYKSIMMIGGVDSDNNKYTGSQYPSCTSNGQTDDGHCVEVVAGAVSVLSTVPAGTGSGAGLNAGGSEYATEALGESSTGSASGDTFFMGTAESTNGGANGKICMIDRGNISFEDKVLNCENSGGIGAVIINNVNDAALSFTLATPTATSIPAVAAFLSDRASLLAAATATVSVSSGDYAKFTGTSMATPTVAGAAALVWSNHPSCTGEDIRAAFKATAEDGGAAGKDVEFGYGIAKSKAASDYITTNGLCGGSTGNQAPTASFTYNCTDLSCSFDGSGSTDSDGSLTGYSWSFGATGVTANYTFASAGTYSVTLTVTDDNGATDSSSQNITVTDSSQPTAPAAPTNLTGNAVKQGKGRNATIVSVDLNWTDNSNNEDGFKVERCVETGKGKNKVCNFAQIATSTSASYSDTSVPDGTVKYRVRAYNGAGDSAYTNEVKF